MKMQNYITGMVFTLVLGGSMANAQKANQWRGGEKAIDWNSPYEWKLNHVPNDTEAAHFREPISVIKVNSTVQLNHGMHLYGNELSLMGNGNINLWSQIPHARTVNIPASGDGFANMTLNDNISLNARVALSSKGFGTSASKGSITLKGRSNVTGDLSIGNAGTGTGQVFLKDNSSYHITGLELGTQAAKGGSAELHILSGTVRIETKKNPFSVFNEDASRRIILGENGTLRFEYSLPVAHKKTAIKQMIKNDRLVAAPGCRLTTPIIQEKLVIIRAEDQRNESQVKTKEQLLAAIDRITAATIASNGAQPKKLDSLLKGMARAPGASSAPAASTPTPAAGGNPALASIMQQKGVSTSGNPQKKDNSTGRVAGYIAFVGAALLMLRRNPDLPEEETQASPEPAKTPAPGKKKKSKRRR